MLGSLRTRGHGCRSAEKPLAMTHFCLRVARPNAATSRRLLLCTPRSLSSVPPTVTSTSEKSPLPEPSVARRVKVELRPAPVKSVDATRPSISPSRLSKPQNPPRANLDPLSSSSPTTSVTETTKHDVEDAISHGILIPPPPNANRFRRVLHQVWQLAKFYLRGLKMINANRKQVAAIKKRVKAGGSPISRWESRFMRTYREDAMKLIPFVITLLLLEEVIPLIAIYAPFMLPSTCILPSQRERMENSKRAKQAAYITNNRLLFRHLSSAESSQVPLAVLRGNAVLAEATCGILSLSTLGINSIRIWRIRRHLHYISEDDELLAKENMGAQLNPLEVTEALFERGIITTGLSEKEKAARLKQWLMSTCKSDRVDPLAGRLFVIARNASQL